MRRSSPDVIVIGAGAIGACTALSLSKEGVKVLLLEKEDGPAKHQSSRNSGVIHAGYNLRPGSLKAKYCVEGNRRLRAYCREHGIPLLEGGILIVGRTEVERGTIEELKRRADANGVVSRIVDGREIKEIEPAAEGVVGLHAPEGASFDSGAFVASVIDAVRKTSGDVRYGCRVTRIDEREGRREEGGLRVQTSVGTFEARALVNCAGLHADRVAGEVSRGAGARPRTPRRTSPA